MAGISGADWHAEGGISIKLMVIIRRIALPTTGMVRTLSGLLHLGARGLFEPGHDAYIADAIEVGMTSHSSNCVDQGGT